MTKGEQARLMAWRSKVLQQAAGEQNVARVCRRFGISRKSFYKWKRRHAEQGDAGLCDRPRTPKCSPRATAREVVSKILYLRQHYHFGPGRIAAYLQRFHREILLDTPTDKFLMSAVNFAAEIEREKARQRVTDSMARRARAGYVCGGRTFGYETSASMAMSNGALWTRRPRSSGA